MSYAQVTVSTLSGSGTAGSDDGAGVMASFNLPSDIAVDAVGNVFVADTNNHKIRKITPSGVVSTLAGSDTFGFVDGIGTSAKFNRPTGIAVDAAGNLYVGDVSNNKIRKITPSGVVSTFAGSGNYDFADGNATEASFRSPSGVAVDAAGYVYVADILNNKIRKITSSGEVTTLAGSVSGSADGIGIAASFSAPTGVAVDAVGNVYVADCQNNKIRKITSSGEVTTLAGSGAEDSLDGTGAAASFYRPTSVELDASGNVYVAEYYSHKIRKVTPSGVVSTFAGSGIYGFADGIATEAKFSSPYGVAVDAAGNVYVSDKYNHKIRKIVQTLSSTEFEICSKYKIFPNPTVTDVTIEFESLTNPSLQVFDVNGRVLLYQNLNSINGKINTSNLPVGMYLFKITSNEGTSISKLVKE